MTTNINADDGVISGVAGLKTSADNSGVLALQTNGTTALTVNASQALGVGSTPSYGTSGQVLTSAGSGASPTWTTVGGGSSQWTTSGSDIYYNTGAVSVGTTTPLLTASGRGNITLNGSTNSILVLANGGTTSGYMFGDASSLGFSAGSGTNSRVMTFDTNGSERMRIDSSGNVGIGVTPTATSSAGIFQNKGGILWAYSNLFQDLTQNAYYDTSYKYSVTSYAATMYRQQGGSHQWYTSPTGTAGNAITFTQSLAFGKGTTLALEGASSQTGTGITFPATQSASSDANTLDDYEEGTWTPAYSVASGSMSANQATGKYTKIGNVVYVWGYISYNSNSGASGAVSITGLPFTAGGGFGQASNRSGGVFTIGNFSFNSNSPNFGNIPAGNTKIEPFISTATGSTGLTFADFFQSANYSQFVFAGQYTV